VNETMKSTGTETQAGFQKSNAPIPSNTHQPFPSSPAPGGIPSLDTAKIAPTSGPAGDGEPLPPIDPDKLHREDRGLFYP
jgi:hypothetical protein